MSRRVFIYVAETVCIRQGSFEPHSVLCIHFICIRILFGWYEDYVLFYYD